MKIRRFSELDLARFITLARTESLEPSMRRYDAEGGSWPYDPVRTSTSDLVRASTPLFGGSDDVPWEHLRRQVESACKHGAIQETANVEVAQVIYDEVLRRGWRAAKFPMGQLSIGSGEFVRYWNDVVLADKDGPFLPFFDYRRQNGADRPLIQQVVFSMQQIGLRDRFPDLSEARLAVVRFTNAAPRKLEIVFHRQSELLSFEELDWRVRKVYEVWEAILRSKQPARRKTGTNDTPDIFERN